MTLDRQLAAIERAVNQLAARAPALLERNDRGGSAERDGYPSGGSGEGRGGGRTVLVKDEHGRDDAVPVTGVEAEAFARTEHGAEHPDPVGRAAKALRHHVDEAVKSLNNALSQVRLGEHLGSHDGRHSNPPTPCLACDRIVECTTDDPLRSGYCSACSTAWYRWKAAEQAEGREPDRARFEPTRRKSEAA